MGKLAEELKSVKTAANLSLERLQSGLKELEAGVELIKSEISSSPDRAADSDEGAADLALQKQQLSNMMSPFYEKAELEVGGLRILYDTTLNKLKDLAVYYGETLKDERLIELFKTIPSPAKGTRVEASAPQDPSCSTTFQPDVTPPVADAHAKPLDVRITSLLKNSKFPGMKIVEASTAADAVDDVMKEENKSPESCEGDCQALKIVSDAEGDDVTDGGPDIDPDLNTDVRYDSDWSTG
ncbi:hypothetical protein R1sor_024870 [Riccia sorocarpa]|uniref:FH2 domain-containing protein n=1 Tax=Riccia sorocarpa TaxID=122646 RepID=A0ABD3GU61_9MARC